MSFNDFKKELKDIKYRSEKDWEIFLPFNTKREKIQFIIDKCREYLLIDWHIIYTEVTEKIPEPEIFMWWEKKIRTE